MPIIRVLILALLATTSAYAQSAPSDRHQYLNDRHYCETDADCALREIACGDGKEPMNIYYDNSRLIDNRALMECDKPPTYANPRCASNKCVGDIVEEVSMPQVSRYINMWGSDDINDHEWQPYTEEAAYTPGINEVSLFPPGTEPTAEQVQAAEDLIKRTKDAAKRHNWHKFGQSLKEGYVAHDISHYLNVEYANDEHVLDPDRPENLMYYWTRDGELKLVGVMYLLRSNTEHGPQVGGPLTVWHFHTLSTPYCWWDGMYIVRNADGSCQNGVATAKSAEMLHVWLVDHPDGPFATSMHVPQEVVDALP